MVGDRDDAESQQGRARDGQEDVPEHLQPTGAVAAGGFFQLFRHLFEGLAHEEGAEGRGDIGRHHALVGVQPAQRHQGLIIGQDEHGGRHHELGEEEEENLVFAAEIQARQGEARQ